MDKISSALLFIRQQPAGDIPKLIDHAAFVYNLNKTEKALFLTRLLEEDEAGEELENAVDDNFVRRYKAYRQIGLTQKEAALALGVDVERLKALLAGRGVRDKELYAKLCAIEMSAPLNMKIKALSAFERLLDKGNARAVTYALEAMGGAEWATSSEQGANAVTDKTCEELALEAAQALREIRERRMAEKEGE